MIDPTATEISAEQLRAALVAHEPVTVLDIRHAPDSAEWSIPGSVHLDVYDAVGTNQASALDAFLPPELGPVVTVCYRGNTSMLAMAQLRRRGIPAVSLHGGMRDWSLAWNAAAVTTGGRTDGQTDGNAEILQIRRTGKGCLSYMVVSAGKAAVIDPSVDPEVYLHLAADRHWTIVAVLDTHVHADHLSRARKLAELAGAKVYLPDQERVKYPFTPLRDGDVVRVGDATLTTLSTPGHTFESACYVLDAPAAQPPSRPSAVFTGDTLFLSTVGRPDLAAKADEETKKRARLLYASLQRLKSLAPGTVVLPCHSSQPVAFDGKALSGTVEEVCRRAELLRLAESEFVDTLLARIPAPPGNHLKIVQLNEAGELPADPRDLEAGANRCAVG